MSKTQISHLAFWLIVALLFGWFLQLISPMLLPFIVGMGVAYILDPLADMLEGRKFSRNLSTTIISISFFSIVGIGLLFLLPLFAEQLTSLIESIPQYFAMLKDSYAGKINAVAQKLHLQTDDAYQKISDGVSAYLQNSGGRAIASVLKSGLMAINFIGLLLITPVVSFYLLRDWDKIVQKVDSLLPQDYAPIIREQLRAIDLTISAFLRGTVNVMLILMLYYAITLSIVGLPYSILLAIIAGGLIIIPFVGTFVSAGGALAITFVHFEHNLEMMMIIGAIFGVGQLLEGYVLTPRFVGKSVGLNPLWIIFGMMAGGTALGFVGVLIAVPLTAVLGVLLRFALEQYKKSEIYLGKNCE